MALYPFISAELLHGGIFRCKGFVEINVSKPAASKRPQYRIFPEKGLNKAIQDDQFEAHLDNRQELRYNVLELYLDTNSAKALLVMLNREIMLVVQQK